MINRKYIAEGFTLGHMTEDKMDDLMDREIRVIIEALQRFAPITLGADRAAAERAISVFQRETENREHD